MKTGYAATAAIALVMAATAAASGEEPKLTVPEVTVTAPLAPSTVPPYLRDPWKEGLRNPMAGRWRNEEDKFAEQPCGTTRISAAAPGSRCLVGYRLTPGATMGSIRPCDLGLDVVMYRSGNLEVEADILSFDPYKITALGTIPKGCRILPYRDYGAEEFRDMNQVTRRGTNFYNLADPDETLRSIEFFDSSRPCIAMRKLGPDWHGGRVWVMHLSVCRSDGKPVSTRDVASTMSALQVRVYDPMGNLVRPPQ